MSRLGTRVHALEQQATRDTIGRPLVLIGQRANETQDEAVTR